MIWNVIFTLRNDATSHKAVKAQVGKYHFGRHHNRWGIWRYDHVTETGNSSRFIKDVYSYEEAVREVYHLNGWGEPKNIRRLF